MSENNQNDDVIFDPLDESGEESIKLKIQKLKDKIKELEDKNKEYLNGWQRAQADYANREKVVAQEKKDIGKFAIKSFISGLIPILDTYDAARANQEAWGKVDENWRSGIEYIFSAFNQKLEEQNLKSFGSVGEKYDQNLHEAVEMVETEDVTKDGTLANVLMKGYKIDEYILRSAKVKVYTLKSN